MGRYRGAAGKPEKSTRTQRDMKADAIKKLRKKGSSGGGTGLGPSKKETTVAKKKKPSSGRAYQPRGGQFNEFRADVKDAVNKVIDEMYQEDRKKKAKPSKPKKKTRPNRGRGGHSKILEGPASDPKPGKKAKNVRASRSAHTGPSMSGIKGRNKTTPSRGGGGGGSLGSNRMPPGLKGGKLKATRKKMAKGGTVKSWNY